MERIQSPRTDDAAIEQDIKRLGADKAPRVTPEDLEATIADVEFVKHVSKTGKVLRWAVLTADNGYAVTGRPSVSVSVENDREEIGQKVALENAKNEMWPLLGFRLSDRIAEAARRDAAIRASEG